MDIANYVIEFENNSEYIYIYIYIIELSHINKIPYIKYSITSIILI
jgi:hypothetical protein